MINYDNVLIVIPARGGSKRLPRKNLLTLGGKSLISWTIEAAIEADLKANIAVSSDDVEILEVAQKYKDKYVIAHRRPDELATDEASTTDAILDALAAEEKKGISIDTIVLLQPTSPLRKPEDIQNAMGRYYASNGEYTTVSVCEVDHPTAWIGSLNTLGEINGIDFSGKRSQNYVKEYRLNGAIYIVPVSFLKKNNSLFTDPVLASVMPRERSWDIDDSIDFDLCSFFLER